MFGYGCHSTYYEPQQANGTNILYTGNYKDKFFGKKQIVIRNYGDSAYQACFGDSGGPLLNQDGLSIYSVISSSDFSKSDEERRNSPTNANFAGRVPLFFNKIRDYINNYRTVCEVSKKTQSGEIIYGLGRCIPKDKIIDWETELPENLKGNLIKDKSSCVNPKENICVELRGNTDWDY